MDNFISRYAEDNDFIYMSTNLFCHPALQDLSFEALMVFGLLYCAQEIQGKPVHVTIQEIRQILRCGTTHASSVMHELLDSPHHLISVKKYPDGHTETIVNQNPK